MPTRRNLSMISCPIWTGQSLCAVNPELGLDSVRVVGGPGADMVDVDERGVARQGIGDQCLDRSRRRIVACDEGPVALFFVGHGSMVGRRLMSKRAVASVASYLSRDASPFRVRRRGPRR